MRARVQRVKQPLVYGEGLSVNIEEPIMHKDLEFQILDNTFKNLGEALQFAFMKSVGEGEPVVLDIVTWSRSAAKAWAGESGAKEYDKDPDASVFSRFVLSVKAKGMVS